MRAILFDVDDTLVDRTGAARRAFAAWIAERPDAFAAGDALAACLAIDAGGTRERDAVARDLAAAFPRLGPAAAIEAELLGRLLDAIALRPDVIGLLAAIPARVAIVSNGSGAVQRAKLARAGLLPHLPPDAIFISGERGFAKPDPRLFALALAWAGVPPGAALHVGDDPERDVAGAARAGVRACWVAHGRAWPSHLLPPAFRIHQIQDLPHLLPALAA